MIDINLCLSKLVDKGLWNYPPEGVMMKDYQTLIDTSVGRGWIPPAIELLESVKDEAELDQAKESAIQYISDMSFTIRQGILPDYKMVNAALGIYDIDTCNSIISKVHEYRIAFYNAKMEIENAINKGEIAGIIERFINGGQS